MTLGAWPRSHQAPCPSHPFSSESDRGGRKDRHSVKNGSTCLRSLPIGMLLKACLSLTRNHTEAGCSWGQTAGSRKSRRLHMPFFFFFSSAVHSAQTPISTDTHILFLCILYFFLLGTRTWRKTEKVIGKPGHLGARIIVARHTAPAHFVVKILSEASAIDQRAANYRNVWFNEACNKSAWPLNLYFSAPLLTEITEIKKTNQHSLLASIPIPSLIALLFKSNVKWKCSHLTLTKCNGMSSQWKGEEHGTELLLPFLHLDAASEHPRRCQGCFNSSVLFIFAEVYRNIFFFYLTAFIFLAGSSANHSSDGFSYLQ